MSCAIVITGVGLVTPLGVGVDATWAALLRGEFITETGRVAVERDPAVSRVGQLALLAAREALADQKRSDAALIVGTSKGPADEWLNDNRPARPCADPPAHTSAGFGLHTLADELARGLDLAGPVRHTLSAACASGLHALAHAKLLLETNAASRAVVVASESSLHPIWHGTFKRLGVLTPPGEPCRPFDLDRRGFLISEAAAAVVLERREPAPGELAVDHAAIGADATHLTGGDPDARTLRRLLAAAPHLRDVDFVHAHATATGSDAIELAAIESAFPTRRPPIYSHKGALGHTLGASGLVGLIISTRIHATRILPPLPTTRAPVPSRLPLAGRRPLPLASSAASLLLASGFGGATALATLRQSR